MQKWISPLPIVTAGIFRSLSLLLGAVAASFLLFTLAPGDPARVMLGPNASEQQVATLRKELGLDQSVPIQAVGHFKRIFTLDLGRSISDGRPVLAQVCEKFAVTATIGLQAALLSLLFSYGLNFLFFAQPRSIVLLPLLRFGVLMPVFLITILGAITLSILFPSLSLSKDAGAVGPFRQLLPAFIASLYPLAVMTTILRERIEDAKSRPSYRAARAYGVGGWPLFHLCLFRPSSVAWLAAWINQLSLVFFASLILEVILSIPGSGNLLLNAVQHRDYPILQGIILLNASFFIAVTWMAELLFPILDPRA